MSTGLWVLGTGNLGTWDSKQQFIQSETHINHLTCLAPHKMEQCITSVSSLINHHLFGSKSHFNDQNGSLVRTNVSSNEFLHYFIATSIDRINFGSSKSSCNRVLPHVTPAPMKLHTLTGNFVTKISGPERINREKLNWMFTKLLFQNLFPDI